VKYIDLMCIIKMQGFHFSSVYFINLMNQFKTLLLLLVHILGCIQIKLNRWQN